MRFQHADARTKRVIKTVSARLDPQQHSNNSQVEKENDVRHVASGKSDRNNRSAAGDGPVRGHIQPLSPHHDSAQFAPIKMRHRIDIAWVVKAPLQRNCTFLFACYCCILSRHNLLFYWITAFAAYSNKSLHRLNAYSPRRSAHATTSNSPVALPKTGQCDSRDRRRTRVPR